MKKVILLLILITSISSCALFKQQPSFPDNIDEIVSRTEQSQRWNFYLGESGYVNNDGLDIWYESIGNPNDPLILLVMGYATSGIAWDKELINNFVKNGYHVVRFDNREIGKSSDVSNWSKKEAYTLSEMADDAVAILDHFGQKQADVVGISMGGMIAQTMAIEHQDRLKSLTSISSTGHFFDKKLKSLTPDLILKNLALTIRYGANPKKLLREIKGRAGAVGYLRNDEKISPEIIEYITQYVLFKKEKEIKISAKDAKHQSKAIKKSGARYEALKSVDIPVLIFHGLADMLIYPEHSQKLQKYLPHAKATYIEGMGHIPRTQDYQQMSAGILEFISKRPDNAIQTISKSSPK